MLFNGLYETTQLHLRILQAFIMDTLRTSSAVSFRIYFILGKPKQNKLLFVITQSHKHNRYIEKDILKYLSWMKYHGCFFFFYVFYFYTCLPRVTKKVFMFFFVYLNSHLPLPSCRLNNLLDNKFNRCIEFGILFIKFF